MRVRDSRARLVEADEEGRASRPTGVRCGRRSAAAATAGARLHGLPAVHRFGSGWESSPPGRSVRALQILRAAPASLATRPNGDVLPGQVGWLSAVL
jgi:hypothetical protein